MAKGTNRELMQLGDRARRMNVWASTPPQPDARTEPPADAHKSPTVGVSPPALVDAHPLPPAGVPEPPVDAKTPALSPLVDAKTPTRNAADAHTAPTVDAHKSDRHRGDRARHHLRLDPTISKKFKVFCADNGLEFQEFVVLAGVHYIAYVDAHKAAGADAKTPHDDLKIYSTDENIISRYREMTGRKWDRKQDQIGKQYNSADRRKVEVGMIETYLNAQGRQINSFKYFTGQIDLHLDTPQTEEALEALVYTRRQQYAAYRAKRAGKG